VNWGITQKWVMTVAPLFTMLTKQRFCVVSFVKKKKEKKENDHIILGNLPLLKKNGMFSRATSPHTHTYPGLFSWATCPSRTMKSGLIVMGDLLR